ncbi:MAG: hypothetical protein JWL97_2966 [Gemmatimonadales bacterium]|nr:hypothetical protein [Gemmatimonadales bacterium]
MAALSTIAAFALAGAAGASAYSAAHQPKPKAPGAPVLPPAIDLTKQAQQTEAQLALQGGTPKVKGDAAGRASTILTGPSGLATPTQKGQTTLLGM